MQGQNMQVCTYAAAQADSLSICTQILMCVSGDTKAQVNMSARDHHCCAAGWEGQERGRGEARARIACVVTAVTRGAISNLVSALHFVEFSRSL